MFNGEKWRIIGSVPTCTSSGCATQENLVKIIRDQSLGGYAWHTSSSELNWNESTLYTLLNTAYYGKTNGTEQTYCMVYYEKAIANCDFRTKGIDPNGYYGKMIKNIYWNTGASSNDTVSEIYVLEKETQTISGYIGLMNASDYGYASSYTRNRLNNYSSSSS